MGFPDYQSPDPLDGEDNKVGFFDEMMIAAILRFFPRFGDLEALRLILDGLAKTSDGQESTRFPEFIRPHLKAMKREIERAHASRCSFLVDRVKNDIHGLMERFTSADADATLGGIYTTAEPLRYAEVKDLKNLLSAQADERF